MSAAATLPLGELDDEAMLLARLRAGDARAFDQLVRENGGRMLATARRFLRHDEDARDAVQDALLQAFRALPRFAGDARLSTWLHRIVINAALMKLRAQRRRPETPLEDVLPRSDADDPRALEPGDREPFPDAQLERAQLRALVRGAIARLPAGYRAVLVMRDVESLDTEETSQRLGTSPGAVKTRLHRARQALRTLIEREARAASCCIPLAIEEWMGAAS
jgi:RNA polymerase sigma-70 factor (ECF subfamily)